jgi:hypothetical protein
VTSSLGALAYLAVVLKFSYLAFAYNNKLSELSHVAELMDGGCTNDHIINKAVLFVANKADNSSISYVMYANIAGLMLLVA